MDSFTITLPLKPKVASRPRVRKGHAYLENGYADWLDEAIILLKMIARKQKIRVRSLHVPGHCYTYCGHCCGSKHTHV